jgi:DNA adenine methylase
MTYPGGKAGAGVYQRIINNMPPHRIYIEGFLGGGAVMLAKRPAIESIGIDADAAVIETWKRYLVPTSNLMLVHGDAIEWLANNTLSDDTLIYLDPPYLMSTRRQQRQIYLCELADHDHERLLDVIKSLRCMVMLSGYWSELYSDALQGWRTDTFTTRTRG